MANQVHDHNVAPVCVWAAITPHDTDELPRRMGNRLPRQICATEAGDIAMIGADGVTATFTFTADEVRDISPAIIKDTGTTATGIIALW